MERVKALAARPSRREEGSLFESRYPAIVMTWGESYLYRKDPVRHEALTGVVHN